jgi:hypothetical protein
MGDIATPTKPLSMFTPLSKVVRLYTPEKTSQVSSPDAPTTILLCSWVDGNAKHIQYYTKVYMKLFPLARIILVQINMWQFLVQTEATRRMEVQAAVTALLASPFKNDRLLVHSFSNGGMRRVYNIAGAYRASTGNPLPVKAYVMDSAPGIPQFKRDMHVFSLPAQRMPWFLRVPYLAFASFVASAVYVSVHWMPRWWWRELVWGVFDGILDPKLIDKNAVRGFIYSKEDMVIDWKDVEAYAKLMEERGDKTEKKLVEGAQHVQLFKGKGGEDDYWGFVKKIWGMAVE